MLSASIFLAAGCILPRVSTTNQPSIQQNEIINQPVEENSSERNLPEDLIYLGAFRLSQDLGGEYGGRG